MNFVPFVSFFVLENREGFKGLLFTMIDTY